MKNMLNSARLRVVLLCMTVMGVFLLLPTFTTDASAVSVPSMPMGTEFVQLYPQNSTAVVVDGSGVSANPYSLLCPVIPGKDYTFRFFNPSGVQYYDRFRLAGYQSYPTAGLSGTYYTQTVNSLVRDGDYISYSFTARSSDYYILIFMWGNYPNNPDLPLRYVQYMSPVLYYDADITVSATPQRFYSGDDVLIVFTNLSEVDTFFTIGYRTVGEADIVDLGTWGGDSYGTHFVWHTPVSLEHGSYEFVILAQPPYQTVTITVPFVVLYNPTPPIPTDSPPVTPDISSLPDASDFVVDIPDEYVDITVSIFGDLIPVELMPLLAMTMVCLFLGVIVRGDKSE